MSLQFPFELLMTMMMFGCYQVYVEVRCPAAHPRLFCPSGTHQAACHLVVFDVVGRLMLQSLNRLKSTSPDSVFHPALATVLPDTWNSVISRWSVNTV